MTKELQSIIRNLENTLNGTPWFGRAVYEILSETDESKASIKPGDTEHSLLELLYHMITWAEFTLNRIQNDGSRDVKYFEDLDWRTIDPKKHDWKKGLAELKKVHEEIVNSLQGRDDAFLNEKVDHREYNYRFLLNGLIQHNIYHLGQIAYLNKLLN
jgi:uncharacterized damage-inducible protein DinB